LRPFLVGAVQHVPWLWMPSSISHRHAFDPGIAGCAQAAFVSMFVSMFVSIYWKCAVIIEAGRPGRKLRDNPDLQASRGDGRKASLLDRHSMNSMRAAARIRSAHTQGVACRATPHCSPVSH
jgi:hypothetical protein